ncbi:Midasin, partial [Stegodyphus mimosarum]
MLLIPRDVTDPAIKNEQKVMHLSTRLRDLHCERGVFAFVSHVANGETLGTVPTHPYVSGLLKICRALENELSAAKEKLIFRSHTDKYAFKNLKEETEQYLTSIGAPGTIIQMFVHLEQAYNNIGTDFNISIASLTQSAENYIKNLQNFSETFVKKFILYKDMTVPFVTGIEQVIFGIRMAIHCIQCRELSIQFPIKDVSISEFLVQFISYSSSNSSDPLRVASLLLDHGNINAFKYLLSLSDSSVVNSERFLYKLLKSAILEIINEAKLRSDLKRNHFKDRLLALLLTGLSFLWNMWKTQEDKAKIKKKEEEALYVHKTRHHERELTEEEVMDKNVLNMFPSYEKDFAEFIKPDPKPKKTRKLDSVAESADLSFFTHDDMFEVWKLHAIAMGRLFPSEYENAHEDIKFIMKDNKDPDYTTSYLLRQEVVNSIVTAVGDRLDLSVETESVSGLILMCDTLQKIKETHGNRYYDIYHDPNPSKVINFRSVLENLSVSVQKLLKKFPENPVLVEIFKIVQRVLSFSVTDPVMKFVIGFELILEASQLWEQNACSEVSLKTEIDELTKTIIECRAMELSCWSRGLDCVIRKQYYNSSKWWFLMFPIFS